MRGRYDATREESKGIKTIKYCHNNNDMEKRSTFIPYEDMKRLDERESCYSDFCVKEEKNRE